MTTIELIKHEHRELLALAREAQVAEAPSPAEAERARRRLAPLAARLRAHLEAEAGEIDGICRVGGSLASPCAVRRREADGLLETIDGLAARWGAPGAIERDPAGFAGAWQVFATALRRLQAREEGEIYAARPQTAVGPIAAPPATGLPGLDRDHERMFAMIGGLRAAIGGGRRHVDAALVAELADVTDRHMADEEEIMAATAYPGTDDHRREHHLARTIILGFRNDHQDGRLVEAADVLAFLERWLATHIGIVDVAMARHALAAGWRP